MKHCFLHSSLKNLTRTCFLLETLCLVWDLVFPSFSPIVFVALFIRANKMTAMYYSCPLLSTKGQRYLYLFFQVAQTNTAAPHWGLWWWDALPRLPQTARCHRYRRLRPAASEGLPRSRGRDPTCGVRVRQLSLTAAPWEERRARQPGAGIIVSTDAHWWGVLRVSAWASEPLILDWRPRETDLCGGCFCFSRTDAAPESVPSEDTSVNSAATPSSVRRSTAPLRRGRVWGASRAGGVARELRPKPLGLACRLRGRRRARGGALCSPRGPASPLPRPPRVRPASPTFSQRRWQTGL